MELSKEFNNLTIIPKYYFYENFDTMSNLAISA